MNRKIIFVLMAFVFFGLGYAVKDFSGSFQRSAVPLAMAGDDGKPTILRAYVSTVRPGARHRYAAYVELDMEIDVAEVKSNNKTAAFLYVK